MYTSGLLIVLMFVIALGINDTIRTTFKFQVSQMRRHPLARHPRSECIWTEQYIRSMQGRCMSFRGHRRHTVASDSIGGSLLNTDGPKRDPVTEALARVQDALNKAEDTVRDLEYLPSAKLPSPWVKLANTMKPVLGVLGVLILTAGMHFVDFVGLAIIGSFIVAATVGFQGYRRSSLSKSGAVAATLVGWGTLASSFRAGMVLLSFFYASSKLTQLSEDQKSVDEDHKKGGQRDWVQVFCNGGVPTLLAIMISICSGGLDLPFHSKLDPFVVRLQAAFFGYYCCCCGDTWASEVGQLSEEEPKLITTLRPVRKGTNGGVTLTGIVASMAGGLFIGLVYWVASIISPTGLYNAAAAQWQLIPYGMVAGLFGSVIDSVLGATVQFTGYNRVTGKITGKLGADVTPLSGIHILDNNGVNLVSASITAWLCALLSISLPW